MANPARPRTGALAPLDLNSPTVASHLLRLHAALTARDLWSQLRLLLRDNLKPESSALEIGQEGDGSRHKVYRHAHPTPPPQWWIDHPAGPWLKTHEGAAVCRLSDVIAPADVEKTPFYERVMKREGWDRRLSILSWRGKTFQGALHFYNRIGGPDFTVRDMRLAEALQPHFHVALSRVLEHEERVVRAEQFALMLEQLPVGMLLLDWECRLLWSNAEATHACAVWNQGERKAAAFKERSSLVVPPSLIEACNELRRQWEKTQGVEKKFTERPRSVSDNDLGLHAQVALREPGASPLLRPTFQIQIDYRRPRGDRNRPVSPGTVALVARLSPREVEVAMRLREGLKTREIAQALRRSPLTIKTQLASIFGKLEVDSRAKAVALLNR